MSKAAAASASTPVDADELLPAPAPLDDEAYALRPWLYAERIQEFRERHNELLEAKRYVQDVTTRFSFDVRQEQYRLGVGVLEAAALIPVNAAGKAAWTQFGSPEAKTWKLRVPPGGLLEEGNEDWLIHTTDYRYLTDNPVHIAFLRQIVKRNGIYGLREMDPGLVALFAPRGAFIGFMEPGPAMQVMAAGATRGW